MKEARIFDFDGVLLNSFPDQFKWFQNICKILGKKFSYSSLEKFREDYREPVYPNMYSFLGFDWNNEKEIIWKEYIQHKKNSQIDLFKGIDKVIIELYKKGRTLAIASSNTREAIYTQLRKHNLEKYFSVVVGKEDLSVENGEPKLKPHPECLLLALDKLNCSPKKAKYVGDQPTDIIAAKRVAEYKSCSLPIVAVTYGYSSKEKLMKMNPEEIAYSPKELLAYL